ncbi:hypothetical protein LguiA_032616 [Lonicera macranthoides]
MGKSGGADNEGLKKGPWTQEEDQKLLAYILQNGHGSWRSLPAKAGLRRCGKSCRLRWTNYLRPDIKRGKFSLQEQQTIIQLHALLGNRWSAIATHLPKRTDNEIKNHWNTHLKKRLTKMGIDPMTHKPKTNGAPSKDTANLCHMAQWESARLEAEARLGRDSNSKLMMITQPTSTNPNFQPQLGSSLAAQLLKKPPLITPGCLDVLKAWQRGAWPEPSLESPTSTLSFSDNVLLIPTSVGFGEVAAINNDENFGPSLGGTTKQVVENELKCLGESNNYSVEFHGTGDAAITTCFTEGFTDLLVDNSSNTRGTLDNVVGNFEESKHYWNSILYVVNSSQSDLPVF